MEGVRKFYPTWRYGAKVGALSALALVAGIVVVDDVVPRLAGATNTDLTAAGLVRVAKITPAIVASFVAMFFAIGRLSPTKATTLGVVASAPWGATRFIPWDDIAKVIPYSVYGLRMLRLERLGAPYAILPVLLDNLDEFSAFASEYAGPNHPLTKWLQSGAKDV